MLRKSDPARPATTRVHRRFPLDLDGSPHDKMAPRGRPPHVTYSSWKPKGGPSRAEKRRNELIGRGVMLIVGLVLLLGAWKCWGAATRAQPTTRRTARRCKTLAHGP